MTPLIDGEAVRRAVRARVAQETLALKEQGVTPGLAVILVGEDPASQVYVRNKEKACAEVGFYSEKYTLPADTTQAQLNALVDELNAKKEINGILCQLPLPPHLSDKEVIAYHYDDVIETILMGMLYGAQVQTMMPKLHSTNFEGMELIRSTGTDLTGKRAVVLGRSNIVGKPMAMLLLHENATVTIAHSKTQNLAKLTRQADVLVAAVGRPKFVTADMVKPGAVVIDVGMDRDENGKLCGDVDFDGVSQVCGAITPVPGGVGPMTISMLLENTLTAAKLQNSL